MPCFYRAFFKLENMNKRYNLIDILRGLAVLNMILYHFIWDLVYFGFNVAWYNSKIGYLWQQYICWSFIFIAGFSFCLGKNNLKRGTKTFLFGLVLSLATIVFVPQNRVLFGILTLIGSCLIIVNFIEKFLKKIDIYAGFVISFILFAVSKNIAKGYIGFSNLHLKLPDFLYTNNITAYLGFPYKTFYSTDYFPIFPWIFLFVCGFYCFLIFERRDYLKYLENIRLRPLEFFGQNAFLIYILHQPILYMTAMVWKKIFLDK